MGDPRPRSVLSRPVATSDPEVESPSWVPGIALARKPCPQGPAWHWNPNAVPSWEPLRGAGGLAWIGRRVGTMIEQLFVKLGQPKASLGCLTSRMRLVGERQRIVGGGA